MTSKSQKKTVETRIKDSGLIHQRRRQIVEGAMKVFIAKGYHKATVREIAEAAGLTMGSMYNYVRSKEDIIYFVYDHITSILRQEMQRAVEGITDPRQRLQAAFTHIVRVVEQYSDEIMFLYRESGSLDRQSLHEVLARETQYIEMFEELLAQCLADQGASQFQVRLGADILAYLPVIVTFRRWSLRKRFSSMEEVKEGLLEFALKGAGLAPLGQPGDKQ